MSEITITKIISEEDLNRCFQIRATVFVEEQNVPMDEEIDGLDGQADHFLLYCGQIPVATARVRYLNDLAKIERVAVLKGNRGHRIGQQLMGFIMADIKKNPQLKRMKLGAQLQVIAFYEKLGFTCCGDIFLDAGIQHRWMICEIT